jgi:hypothetical protein
MMAGKIYKPRNGHQPIIFRDASSFDCSRRWAEQRSARAA